MTTMPDLTLSDIARLEAAADKATPGPWTWTEDAGDGEELNGLDGDTVIARRWNDGCGYGAVGSEDDRAHIANCDPATVKALCAVWRELESLKADMILAQVGHAQVGPGIVLIPTAAHLFYASNDEALEFLKSKRKTQGEPRP